MKRAAVTHARQRHGLSECRACRLIGLARSTQRRKLKAATNEELGPRLGQLARERHRFGYRRLTNKFAGMFLSARIQGAMIEKLQ